MTGLAIANGRLVPRPGDELQSGTVVIRDGVIESVGSDRPPSDLEIIDADGRWVTAGLVDAHVHIGIHEEAKGVAGTDTNETTRPNTAGVRAIDAIDIHDIGFDHAISGGVTTVIVKPGSGNPIGGLAVPMKTWGHHRRPALARARRERQVGAR